MQLSDDNPLAQDAEDPVAQLQRDVAELQAKLEALDQGELHAHAIRSVLSRLGTAPANLHQAVVFFLSSDKEVDAEMKRHAPLMFVGRRGPRGGVTGGNAIYIFPH